MVDKSYDIRWDKLALVQFKEIYIYIRKDSYQNAQKVKRKVLQCIEGLKSSPFRHNPDKFRTDGNPGFRSFEVYGIRVTYFVDDAEDLVNIIRVRSTRQDPLSH